MYFMKPYSRYIRAMDKSGVPGRFLDKVGHNIRNNNSTIIRCFHVSGKVRLRPAQPAKTFFFALSRAYGPY